MRFNRLRSFGAAPRTVLAAIKASADLEVGLSHVKDQNCLPACLPACLPPLLVSWAPALTSHLRECIPWLTLVI